MTAPATLFVQDRINGERDIALTFTLDPKVAPGLLRLLGCEDPQGMIDAGAEALIGLNLEIDMDGPRLRVLRRIGEQMSLDSAEG